MISTPPSVTAATDIATVMTVWLHDVLDGAPGSLPDACDRGDDSQRSVSDIRVVASRAPAAAARDSWSGHSEPTGEAHVQAPEELAVETS
jgi:hypothetical protein